MLSAEDISRMVAEVLEIHDTRAKEEKKRFRKSPNDVPFGVHPTLAALLFLQEETLPASVREIGFKALLAHDILEDTTSVLPAWACHESIKPLAEALTFAEEEDFMTQIWFRGELPVLLKFYDCVTNLWGTKAYSSERAKERATWMREKMLPWMFRYYPDLTIVKVAEGLLGT